MMGPILVTGAAGKVGSVVARHLIDRGFEVLASDRRPDPLPGFPVRVADLLDPVACHHLVEGVETIVHIGNLPGAGTAIPQDVYCHNTRMNINLLEAAASAGVRRVFFTSTLKVYGVIDPVKDPSVRLPLDGETRIRPADTYALGKLATEEMLRFYSKKTGMQNVVFRLPHMGYPHWKQCAVRERKKPFQGTAIDDFLRLDGQDFARLIAATLPLDLPGTRIWFPVSPRTFGGEILIDLLRQSEALAPLCAGLDAVVNLHALSEATGWNPEN